MSEHHEQPMTDAKQASESGDSKLSAERQTELKTAYEANLAAGRAPYAEVRFMTRNELEWVMHERDWPLKTPNTIPPENPANLSQSVLRSLDLAGIFLQGANLSYTELSLTDLSGADLDYANLNSSRLYNTNLSDASLYNASLVDADLRESTKLIRATMNNVNLTRAKLDYAHLDNVKLWGANLTDAALSGAELPGANLERANLTRANLEYANLNEANLERANLNSANLEHADLGSANLRDAQMDAATVLVDSTLNMETLVADTQWNGTPLTRIRWDKLIRLGDERLAREAKTTRLPRETSSQLYEYAVRANRQLAVALRGQALNEQADRFAYRAQLCERVILRRQLRLPRYFGSLFLDLISGYGYKPVRSFITYAVVVLAFAAAYFSLGVGSDHALSWNEAIVISMTAFHGRGFFSSVFQPGDLQAAVAAVEAFIGLLIEIVFIATFTQRFFAR